jgi:hypothetical protein
MVTGLEMVQPPVHEVSTVPAGTPVLLPSGHPVGGGGGTVGVAVGVGVGVWLGVGVTVGVGVGVGLGAAVWVTVAVTVTGAGFGTVQTTVIRWPVPVSVTTGFAVQAALVVAAWTAIGTPTNARTAARAIRACL